MKIALCTPFLVALLPFAPSGRPVPDDGALPNLSPALPVAGPAIAARGGEHDLDPRDVVTHAKISLEDAIGRAVAARPGRAVEADLEGEVDDEDVQVFFEVMVLTEGGELFEVHIDPMNGAVQSNEEAEEDEDEIPGFRAALRHSELDLQALVEKAKSYVKGTPVSASLEFEHGSPLCDVAVVNTRFVIDVELEARAGHLVELELRPEMDGDEHQESTADEEENGADEDGDEEEAEEEAEEHEERVEIEERSEKGKHDDVGDRRIH